MLNLNNFETLLPDHFAWFSLRQTLKLNIINIYLDLLQVEAIFQFFKTILKAYMYGINTLYAVIS